MYDSSLRRRALIVLHSCISTLGVMSGAFQKETRALMAPMLKSWLEQFSLILSPPVPVEDPDDWSLRMEVLKCLQQIVHNFAKLASTEFPVVLGPLWQTFVSGYKVYDSACVNAEEESFGGLADSDGSEQSLEAFTIQIFEFLLTAVASPRFKKIVQNMEELVYYTIGYMQMTEEQEQTWSADPNQYVADEDDVTFSCRVSGILLLEELVENFEDKALQAIVDAVQKRLVEASQAKAAGRKNWWKMREAAVLAVGSIAGNLFEAQAGGTMSFRLESFLDNLREEDLGQVAGECPFLRGRALWAAAKFAPAMNRARAEQFFYAAVTGLASDVPAPIKIGACRALAELFPSVDSSVLQPHLGIVFASLGGLLQEASDETLHLILETLQSAVKADNQASAAAESSISPLVLNIWAKNVADPFISIDALETLEAIKEVPGCLEPLVARVLPFLATIFANIHQQPTGMIAAALDLLTMLLKKAPKDLVRRTHDVTFLPVVNIVLRSEDNSELQNATETLSAFVREGGEELLSWSGDPTRSLQMLLDAAGRLLNPELESSSALFVGGFITALILNMSSNMAPHFGPLITALLARIRGSEMIALKTSIIIVIARLVHMSAPNVAQFVDVVASLPGDYDALEYLMSEWAKLQGDIQGSYQLKVSTTALALLLDCGHPQLSRISVQGHLLTNGTGIVTRSRSKVAPIQYTTMALPAKILSLLADTLLEIQDQRTPAPDEDDEWDEIDEDEDESKSSGVSAVPGSEKSVFKALDEMQHLYEEDIEDGDYQEDPVAASDPINQINLSVHLRDFMKQFLAKDPATSERLFQELNPRQKAAVQAAVA
ncbi:hypothetical protein R1sor_017564 [Riccia sorocarpa]|uniref:Importin 9 n=1 Tax=Riccia sorocarpa TaxID=122646 RepID=A0ABD3I793_9MARC